MAFALALAAPAAHAHEILPAIADMERDGNTLRFDLRLNLEGILSGIDLGAVANSDLAPEAADYNALRALPAPRLAARFQDFWPDMAGDVRVLVDGAALSLELDGVEVPEIGDPALTRTSTLRFHADLPAGARAVTLGWAAAYGAMVVRQNGVKDGYAGYLEPGQLSPPVALAGGNAATPLGTFLRYIPVGFDHIVPKGLDHILFVLGLFFFSTRLRPLLMQVSAFTLAHTITLAAAGLGYVRVPASIVEPVIAASIVFVAVENILSHGQSRWRPLLVFGFGLLHGLGFASVLGEFGLPDRGFLAALIGFNLGVEVGQIAVIAAAYVMLAWWMRAPAPHFARISVMASIAIAAVGLYWFAERIV
ncbi:HupE/UreJ family protein [Defluviimonas sp. WL0075]|uniref:HupE/UreJ family protein n=1 Tax=Albidovulum sediminicola TaxID=2984331 RepID=A0ABT2Z5S1_9RHOB|nr:HupE/UreJ family protein [Defluviimonas sp. WL0075]MCV2866380.1 HupE/UreJ family protein [Defluviimonas sp. WL0075]